MLVLYIMGSDVLAFVKTFCFYFQRIYILICSFLFLLNQGTIGLGKIIGRCFFLIYLFIYLLEELVKKHEEFDSFNVWQKSSSKQSEIKLWLSLCIVCLFVFLITNSILYMLSTYLRFLLLYESLEIIKLNVLPFPIQFSSVAQLCPTLCDPMNCSTLGLPVHHHLPEFTQTHVHRVRDAIQPSHPLSSPSPPALNPSQHQSPFQ